MNFKALYTHLCYICGCIVLALRVKNCGSSLFDSTDSFLNLGKTCCITTALCNNDFQYLFVCTLNEILTIDQNRLM